MSFPDGPPTPDLGLNPARRGGPVTQGELIAALQHVWNYVLAQTDEITRIGEQIMSDQDTLNAVAQGLADLNAKVTADDAALVAAQAALQAEIDALKNQPAGTPLDFSGVNSALAALQGAISSNSSDIASVAAMVPAPAPSGDTPAPPAA